MDSYILCMYVYRKKFNQMPLRQSDGPPGRDQYSVEPIVTTAGTVV